MRPAMAGWASSYCRLSCERSTIPPHGFKHMLSPPFPGITTDAPLSLTPALYRFCGRRWVVLYTNIIFSSR
jgi:hypothetical protein